jgi:hypothetical protein
MPKDHLPEVGPNLQKLSPDRLHMDGGTQPRGRLDDDVVERYAEAMVAGLWEFNKSSAPITAFSSERSQTYWLADGFHRVAAAKKAGLEWVEVDIRQGNQRDAILYSVGTNATHGLPRSNDDKRHAVSRLLGDPEWSQWSDREIARLCHVDHRFVGRLREALTGDIPSERTYKTKHGTVATMNTTAIGGKFEAIDMPAAPAVQLEGGGTETEQAGATDLTDFREAPHRDGDHAKPAAKYDSGMQGSLKYYLQKDDFGSVVRHPVRQVAAAARTFKPKTLEKVRRRMERHRQWLSDFLAALDDDSTEH